MSAQNRFLVVFGGGSVAHCYNDVSLLDTKTNEWSSPATDGVPPTPRAGAAPAMPLYFVSPCPAAGSCAFCACVCAIRGQSVSRTNLKPIVQFIPSQALKSAGMLAQQLRPSHAWQTVRGANGQDPPVQ